MVQKSGEKLVLEDLRIVCDDDGMTSQMPTNLDKAIDRLLKTAEFLVALATKTEPAPTKERLEFMKQNAETMMGLAGLLREDPNGYTDGKSHIDHGADWLIVCAKIFEAHLKMNESDPFWKDRFGSAPSELRALSEKLRQDPKGV